MNKYLINFYEVEEGSWNFRSCFTIDSIDLAKRIQFIESLGFRQSMSNFFVKTFTSSNDEKSYHVYSIVELPKL